MNINIQLNRVNQFFSFLSSKLKNYPSLSLGEQIAYPAIAAGFLLIIVSIVMFII